MPAATRPLRSPVRVRSRRAPRRSVSSRDAPEGAVAVCEEQTAGRGRLGRSWQAPAGTAILCSIVLRPPASHEGPPSCRSSPVSRSRRRSSARRAARLRVKWPNDVLLDGRKVAGILAEGRSDGVVLGIGLNVNQAESELPEPLGNAAGVALHGRRRPSGTCAAARRAPRRSRASPTAAGSSRVWRRFAPELARRDALRGRELEIDGLRGVGGRHRRGRRARARDRRRPAPRHARAR